MPMIETVNLTKKYGDFVALDNLNLTIEEGTCFGFIGPNGAGKTTTIKILATLLKPTWGEARIDGKVVGYQNHLIRPLIGYVPDFMGAYQDMTVGEYLEFFAACYSVPASKRERTITEVLTLTDLTHKTETEVNGLSRGMQQRLAVARVLIHDPKVLLMDEKFLRERSQLPFIKHSDFQAKLLGLVPGDIVLILRPSPTAGVAPYWRMCSS